MSKQFTFKGQPLYNGIKVNASIEGTEVIGAIRIIGNSLYLCQNRKSGSTPSDGNYLGYNSTWVFNEVSADRYDSGVIINHLLDELSFERMDINMSTSRVASFINKNGYQTLSIEETTSIYIKKDNKSIKSSNVIVNICSTKSHPDCCGCTLAYGFDGSSEESYSRYKKLSDEDYEKLKELLKTYNTPLLAHLAQYQESAVRLVERLGFIKRFEYKNPNSSNMIYVYQYQND